MNRPELRFGYRDHGRGYGQCKNRCQQSLAVFDLETTIGKLLLSLGVSQTDRSAFMRDFQPEHVLPESTLVFRTGAR